MRAQREEVRWQQAVASCLRAMSGKPWQGRLPAAPRRPSPRQVALVRGRADALALHLAWHDPALHREIAPDAGPARALFDALEQLRVETLGASRLAGVASNLAALHGERFSSHGDVTLTEALPVVVRARLFPAPPPAFRGPQIEGWRVAIETRAGAPLAQLATALSDQRAFGETVWRLLAALDLAPTRHEEPRAPGALGTGSANLASFDQAEDAGDEDLALQPPATSAAPAGPPGYRVFDRSGDELVAAESLVTAEELAALRSRLDAQLAGMATVAGQLAHRLQRHLQAQQVRGWELDVDDGLLDAARLARVVIEPGRPLSFKREIDSRFRDTVVTLLLDSSGSMRGRPIAVAAACADVLGRALERCGVRVELLGFTTRTWKGGDSRDRWLAAGRPPSPGRLNELRHIVYKSADVPWRRARKNLGVLLKDDLLKQNIDGEALEWASERLLRRRETRRILLVISDGAPVDETTLAANDPGYLERHLRSVITRLERHSGLELAAIGIGHDVSRYYRRAITVVDAEELGSAMTSALIDLFRA